MNDAGFTDEVGAGCNRIRLIARHTLHALLALRVTWVLGLLGVALTGLALWLRTFNFGLTELKFIGDFGLGVVGFFGTVLAVMATAQVFFNALSDGTLHCVLTRRVRRGEYLLGQLAGVMGLLALFTAAVGGLLVLLLAWRGSQLGATDIGLPVWLAGCALQWGKLCLVAAMTLLLCTYAGSVLFASCLGLLLALLGHWRGLAGVGGVPGWLLLWPDLSRFDGEVLAGANMSLPGLAVYWGGYMALFVGLAGYAFKHREL